MHEAAHDTSRLPGILWLQEAEEEWEPRFGWKDFNPHATLVLHLGRSDSATPLRFTSADMRAMTHAQFLEVTR